MTSRGGGSADAFAEMARALLAEADVQRTLQKICDLAVDTIPGCDFAGISFLKGRLVDSPAASGDVPRIIDAIQYETGEGPCLDAIRDHEVFETGDLGSERRWPNFAARAQRETGITSILGVRLFVAGDTLGALNLYSKDKDAFDSKSRSVGLVFAAHAAVALAGAIQRAQMEEALQSRDLIGQAKGILMAREGITADQAFDMLRRASQRLNLKLHDVAGGIVNPSGASPGGEGGEGSA